MRSRPQYQQNYVQQQQHPAYGQRQQYNGNERRGEHRIRIRGIEIKRTMVEERIRKILDVVVLGIREEEVVLDGSIVRTWRICIMVMMSGR
jgi:hypothetical protein